MQKIVFLIFFIILHSLYTNCSYSFVLKNIDVEGNNRINKQTIIDISGLKIGDNITDNDLNNSLKNIYHSGNFADVSISQNNGNILISTLETPIIGDVYFVGSDKFDSDEIKKNMLTKPRQVYSKNNIKIDLERFYMAYQKMGFLDVNIEPRVVYVENNSVDIIFNFIESDISYIKNIYFTGNEHFSSKKLKEQIMSNEKSIISIMPNDGNFEDEKLSEDSVTLQLFYKNNGYAKAEITNYYATFDKKNYNFSLFFEIKEGKKYKFGNSTFSTNIKLKNIDKINSKITTKKNKLYSINEIKNTLKNIKNILQEQGYANIEPTFNLSFDEENNVVDIDYILSVSQKYYIDKITISGNEKTKDKVILRELQINEGDLYDKDKIQLSKDRIWMLGYFDSVEIEETIIPNSDLIALKIVVKERFFGKINFMIGYNGYYGITGSIGVNINNFLGRGYIFGIGIERSGYIESYSINFFDPYFFNNYNIGFGASFNFSRFGDLGGGSKYISYLPYKGYSFSGTTSFSFELTNRLTLTTSFGFTKYVYKMLYQYNYKLYNQLLGNRNSYFINLSLIWNKLNRARFATQGFMLRYNTKISGFGFLGGQQFIQNTATFIGKIQLLGEDLILHTEISGGITNTFSNNRQIISGENLFTLGGYSKMRGFDFYGIGPRMQMTNTFTNQTTSLYYATESTKYYYLSAELRTPLFIPKDYNIFFSAFIDAGAAWGFSGNIKTLSYLSNGMNIKEVVRDTSKIRVSAGIGISWVSTMFGEIGFYYAKPIVKQTYDTTLEFGIKMGANLY